MRRSRGPTRSPPTRLVSHLLSAAASRGAEVVAGDAVTGIESTGNAVRAVRLASGRRIVADAVVNCAGPRAAEVARLAGLTLPMRNTYGVLVHTTPVAVWVSRVVHAPRVHLRPDAAEVLGEDRDEALAAFRFERF